MNAAEMTLAFHYFSIQRYQVLVPNVFVDRHEWDLAGVRKSGFVDEIEIKVSRADFLADFKKVSSKRVPLPVVGDPPRHWHCWRYIDWPKHDMTSRGERKCNYFWYLMPDALADKCEPDIPDHAGLAVARLDRYEQLVIEERKKAPRLHKEKHGDHKFTANLMRLATVRYWGIAHRNKTL